jgi:hypothetical protein
VGIRNTGLCCQILRVQVIHARLVGVATRATRCSGVRRALVARGAANAQCAFDSSEQANVRLATTALRTEIAVSYEHYVRIDNQLLPWL